MSRRLVLSISAFLLVSLLAILPVLTGPTSAMPLGGAREARLAAQNVDWLSADEAGRLDLSFPVLVPTSVPEPFSGSPSIQGSGRYYSLYWMISGGSPTFLQISGEVGGSLPVGSPADLNVRLSVNASVQGYDAIHDVTSIYDNVWWVADDVLYTVSSRNMTGTDSLSLANSLVRLEQPAAAPTPTTAPEPTLPPDSVPSEGPSGEVYNASSVPSANIATIEAYPSASSTLRASQGSFVESGASSIGGVTGGSFSWQAPSVDSDTTVEFTLIDEATGTMTASSSIMVYPTSTGGSSGGSTTDGDEIEETPTSESVESDEPEPGATVGAATSSTDTDTEELEPGGEDSTTDTDDDTLFENVASALQTPVSGGTNGATISDGTAGPQMPRSGDGTAGPALPTGGDGTGGIREIAVP